MLSRSKSFNFKKKKGKMTQNFGEFAASKWAISRP